MKILILSHAAGTPEIGPNMRTYFLGMNLIKQGHQVYIVGSGVFHKYKISPLQRNKYTAKEVEGISYHWLPTFNYTKRNYQQVLNQIDYVFKLWKFRKKWLAINPDVVIISSPPPFAIFMGIFIAKKCNAKLSYEIRDLWPEIIQELGNFSSNHPYLKLLRYTVKKIYLKADGIVSVKPGDLAYLEENYMVKGKTTYIPNGFDHKNINDEPFKHDILSSNSFKVIYTGALSNYYAIAYLLRAAEKLKETHPEIKIIVVGDGDDKETYLKIKNEKDLNNVEFMGFLPKKNMLSIIRQGDVAFLGLRDTKANRFGISTNKLYEYMYAKKPIIASYRTDYDLVEESNCGLSVEPESGEAIYQAIIALYKMPMSEREKLGVNGYEYLLKKHTFEIITKKYLKFINSI